MSSENLKIYYLNNKTCSYFSGLSETGSPFRYLYKGIPITGIVIDEINQDKTYFKDGLFHREDGEYRICFNGLYKNTAYALNGRPLTREVWFSMLTAEQKFEAVWNLE